MMTKEARSTDSYWVFLYAEDLVLMDGNLKLVVWRASLLVTGWQVNAWKTKLMVTGGGG